ncbi:hypothetical protein HDU92_006554 [Lobulomyces angularis]|nr:hypothetical protein HDU92_006554 [Lobulomyces angularis]
MPTCDNVPCNKLSVCEVKPQTATECAKAVCVPFFKPDTKPVICPQVIPTCDNVPCNKLSVCEVKPQTATECAKAVCVPFFKD